jgi:hypothetical protein
MVDIADLKSSFGLLRVFDDFLSKSIKALPNKASMVISTLPQCGTIGHFLRLDDRPVAGQVGGKEDVYAAGVAVFTIRQRVNFPLR